MYLRQKKLGGIKLKQNIQYDDKRRHVLRRPGQRGDTCNDYRKLQQGVCLECHFLDIRAYLIVISGTVTAQFCDDNILQPVMLSFILRHLGLTFQHYNARNSA